MRTAKERPTCRKSLLHLHPNPTPQKWDGETALDSEGAVTELTDGQRKQMRKMIGEGFWGEPFLHRRKPKETAQEREQRLQQLCDIMTLLDEDRPIAVNSGERLVLVDHSWPRSLTGEYRWREVSYSYERIPIEKPPYHYVPAWVFEPENPVSATARVTFAYLCNRGLLNEREGEKVRMIGAGPTDIRDALSIPLSTAQSALNELEDLEIISIISAAEQQRKQKVKGIYCTCVSFIEDLGRWARIKAAQVQDEWQLNNHTGRASI
jgi:hypothetical protein